MSCANNRMAATVAKTPPIEVISSIEQMRALSRQFGLALLAGQVPRLRFAITGLSEASNREASERMSNYQSECGCFAGGLLTGLFAITFIIHYFVSGHSFVGGGLKSVALLVALLLGSSLVGKILGLLWARIRMIRLIRRMAARAERELVDAVGLERNDHGTSL